MTREEASIWLLVKYPVAIVSDRYYGCYSEAEWTAFPLDPCDIPEDIYDEDIPCAMFWENYKEPVGRGHTPDTAFSDLIAQIRAIRESL